MVTKPHSVWIGDEDWKCLEVYSAYSDPHQSCAKIIRDLISEFLTKNKDAINKNRDRQEKSMSKRNVGLKT